MKRALEDQYVVKAVPGGTLSLLKSFTEATKLNKIYSNLRSLVLKFWGICFPSFFDLSCRQEWVFPWFTFHRLLVESYKLMLAILSDFFSPFQVETCLKAWSKTSDCYNLLFPFWFSSKIKVFQWEFKKQIFHSRKFFFLYDQSFLLLGHHLNEARSREFFLNIFFSCAVYLQRKWAGGVLVLLLGRLFRGIALMDYGKR